MVRAIFGCAVGFAMMLPTVANAMSVAEFLGKADALKAKGMAAMFSSDIGVLKAEISSAATMYRADAVASKPPRSCPPPKGAVKTSSDELIANFRTIPAQHRSTITVRKAFADYMTKRFPC